MKKFYFLLLIITSFNIINAQNVGIGEATPSTKFEIKGDAGTDLFNIKDQTNDSKLYIKNNGNVGIGQSNPLYKLDVSGTIKGNQFKDASGELIIRSSNQSLEVSEDSDGSYNLKVRKSYEDWDEPGTKASSGILQPRIAMYNGTATYGTIEENTNIFVNGNLQISVSSPSIGSFSVNQGDLISSDKPTAVIDNGNGLIIPPLTASGKFHAFYSSRSEPHQVYIHAPNGTAKVDYYLNADNSGGIPSQSITVDQGKFGNITLSTNGAHRFYSSAPVIIVALGTGGDNLFVPPASKEILHSMSENRYAMSASTTINSIGGLFFTSDFPLSSTQIADGAGGDAELGLPYNYLGDTYILPHTVNDFAVTSVDPNTISVYSYNGSSFVLENEYDLSAASRTNPVKVEVGDQSGAGTLYTNSPVMVTGTAPFYLRTNSSGSTEYSPIGYRSRDRDFSSNLNGGGSHWNENSGDIYNNNAGNVGIGTSSPSSTLHVNGTVRFENISSGSQTQALMLDGSGNLSSRTLNISNWDQAYSWGNHASAGYLTSEVDPTWSGTANTTSTINRSGKIGLGTTNPGGKLHISGGATSGSFPNSSVSLEIDNSGDGLAGIQLNGSTAPYRIAIQDGHGRVHHYWNAYDSGSEHRYDVTNEVATWMETGSGAGFEFRTAPTGNAGDVITWDLGLKVDDGRVGVSGGTNSNYELYVSGKIGSNGINETSDIRFKKNIQPLENSLDKLMEINGVSYYWKVDEFPDRNFNSGKDIGVIAQEIEKIFPEVVETDDQGYKSVQYSHLVPVLIEAIKEQQIKIKTMETRHAYEMTCIQQQMKDYKSMAKDIEELKSILRTSTYSTSTK